MDNMFDVKGKEMQGKVVVRTRESNLVKGAVIRHVVRNVSDDAVILKKMTEQTDIVKINDMVTVMSAFVSSIKEVISSGNAVRISGLGTFYLTAKEGEDGENEFDIAFAAAGGLTEAARNAEAEVILPSESKPEIETVQDMNSMEENGKASAEGLVIMSGKRMRVAGDDADTTAAGNASGVTGAMGASSGGTGALETGIFMAPCDEYDNYKTDMSDWVRVDDKEVKRNFMTEVIFRVPKIAGKYRIVIATKAPLNGSTRADKLLKHARVGASAVIMVE